MTCDVVRPKERSTAILEGRSVVRLEVKVRGEADPLNIEEERLKVNERGHKSNNLFITFRLIIQACKIERP